MLGFLSGGLKWLLIMVFCMAAGKAALEAAEESCFEAAGVALVLTAAILAVKIYW